MPEYRIVWTTWGGKERTGAPITFERARHGAVALSGRVQVNCVTCGWFNCDEEGRCISCR